MTKLADLPKVPGQRAIMVCLPGSGVHSVTKAALSWVDEHSPVTIDAEFSVGKSPARGAIGEERPLLLWVHDSSGLGSRDHFMFFRAVVAGEGPSWGEFKSIGPVCRGEEALAEAAKSGIEEAGALLWRS